MSGPNSERPRLRTPRQAAPHLLEALCRAEPPDVSEASRAVGRRRARLLWPSRCGAGLALLGRRSGPHPALLQRPPPCLKHTRVCTRGPLLVKTQTRMSHSSNIRVLCFVVYVKQGKQITQRMSHSRNRSRVRHRRGSSSRNHHLNRNRLHDGNISLRRICSRCSITHTVDDNYHVARIDHAGRTYNADDRNGGGGYWQYEYAWLSYLTILAFVMARLIKQSRYQRHFQ